MEREGDMETHDPRTVRQRCAADRASDVSYRLRSALLVLPVWLAAVIAACEILSYGGLYFPDTTQFVRHGPSVNDFVWQKPFFNVIPPAYPIVLDLIAWVAPPGARMFVLVLLQQTSVVVGTWMVLRIGLVLERPWLGWTAALLNALYVPLGLFAQSAQTETLAVFFMIASSYFLVRAIKRCTWPAGLADGAFAALCVAQRIAFVAVPIAAMLAVWIGKHTSRRRLTLLYGAAFAVLLFVFVAKNYWHFGAWRLVHGSGIHLWCRVAMLEQRGPDTPALRTLHEVGKKAGLESVFFNNAGWMLWWPLTQHTGGDPFAADAILRQAALDAMQDDPWRSLALTVKSMTQMARPLHSANDEHFWGGLRPEGYEPFRATAAGGWAHSLDEYNKRYDAFPGYAPQAKLGTAVCDALDRWMRLTQTLFKGTWTLLTLAAIGLWGLRRRAFLLILTSATALGLLAVAALGDQPFARYWEVALPMMFLAWSAAINNVTE